MLNKFGEMTGVYALLNTSFNNDKEPIVDNVNDAINSFLTIGLDNLIIGDYLISSKKISLSEYKKLIPNIFKYYKLNSVIKYTSENSKKYEFYISANFAEEYRVDINRNMYLMLSNCDGKKTIGELINNLCINNRSENEIIEDFIKIWKDKIVFF